MLFVVFALAALCSTSTTTAQFMDYMPNWFGGGGGGFGGFGDMFSGFGMPGMGMGGFQSQPQPNFGGGGQGGGGGWGWNPFGGMLGGGQGQGQGQGSPQQPGSDLGGQQQQPGFGGQQPFGPQNFQQQQPGGGGGFGGGQFDPNSQMQGLQQRILNVFKTIPGMSSQNGGGGGGGGAQSLFPNLQSITSAIGSSGFFFDFNPTFRGAVRALRNDLMGINNPNTLAQTISQLADLPELNRQVLVRASVGALLQRSDISNFKIPSLLEVNPAFVLPTETVNSVRDQVQVPQQQRQCVTVDGNIGQDNGPENALWYFREDVMVNSHHWFWHLTYPMGPETKPDRSGELFAYMHANVLARYNAERLSNGFPLVVPFFLGQGAVIAEGYNPHLTNADAAIPWQARATGRPVPQDVQMMNLTIGGAVSVFNRLVQAVTDGVLLQPDGNTLSLNSFSGIDSLGVTTEAERFSINPGYYSMLGLHNIGHVFISNVDNTNGQNPPGVMAETSTSMRDIVFYRWHAGVNLIFQVYKERMAAYQLTGGDFPLALPGVSVAAFQVQGRSSNQRPNQLATFWTTHNVNLDNGLDFFRNPQSGSVPLCVRHLDHEEFDYQITIRKDPAIQSARVAVRVLMAPRLNEQGQRFSLQDQRPLFFVMDTFTITLQQEITPIVRRSEDSSLTIGWPQTENELNSDQNRTMTYCGCGWPRHLLLPRGNANGMAFDMFVMVTSETDSDIPNVSQVADDELCEQAYIFCGLRNRRYPDTKPMGFPFDRLPYSVQGGGPQQGSRLVQDLDEYVAGLPNTAAIQVQIVHQAG